MTAGFLDEQPHLLDKWSDLNPMKRIGRPDEMRGVSVWLASDASSFCTGSEYVEFLLKRKSILIVSYDSIIVDGGHRAW